MSQSSRPEQSHQARVSQMTALSSRLISSVKLPMLRLDGATPVSNILEATRLNIPQAAIKRPTRMSGSIQRPRQPEIVLTKTGVHAIAPRQVPPC